MHTPARVFGFVLLITLINVHAQVKRPEISEAWYAAKGRDGVQRVNIVCGDDYIDPPRIILRPNVPTEVSVRTTDGLPSHNFMIDVPGLKPIKANSPIEKLRKKFDFHPNVPGTYDISCEDNAAVPNASPKPKKKGTITVARER